jgi:hypothetical protein
MILQYNDELKKEGFRTETKKKFLFGDGIFIADLYAESDDEKRIYDFQIVGRKESQMARTEDLNGLAKSINAKPIVIYVNPPIEKHIVFEDLEAILNEYFTTGEVPSELSALSENVSVSAVTVEDIITAALETSLITISACATIYVNIKLGYDSEADNGESKIYCENFPLSFTIGLDFDFNCKTIEYEIDTSDFELKIESIKKTQIPGNKNYISKTRFDTEFKIYQEISESVLTLVSEISVLFPHGLDTFPKNEAEDLTLFEELFQKASETYNLASRTINKYAPFISKKIFELLEILKNKCRLQIYWYGEFALKGRDASSTQVLIDEYKNCGRRTAEIIENQNIVLDYLRTYLENLDVKE